MDPKLCHLEDQGGYGEDHGLIEDGVGVIPLGGRLLLADLSAILQEVHLDKLV